MVEWNRPRRRSAWSGGYFYLIKAHEDLDNDGSDEIIWTEDGTLVWSSTNMVRMTLHILWEEPGPPTTEDWEMVTDISGGHATVAWYSESLGTANNDIIWQYNCADYNAEDDWSYVFESYEWSDTSF